MAPPRTSRPTTPHAQHVPLAPARRRQSAPLSSVSSSPRALFLLPPELSLTRLPLSPRAAPPPMEPPPSELLHHPPPFVGAPSTLAAGPPVAPPQPLLCLASPPRAPGSRGHGCCTATPALPPPAALPQPPAHHRGWPRLWLPLFGLAPPAAPRHGCYCRLPPCPSPPPCYFRKTTAAP